MYLYSFEFHGVDRKKVQEGVKTSMKIEKIGIPKKILKKTLEKFKKLEAVLKFFCALTQFSFYSAPF